MKSLAIKLLLLTAILLSLSCSKDEETITDDITLDITYNYSPIETELVQRTNSHRVEIGMPSLQLIDYISVKCKKHNDYMMDGNIGNDYFYIRSEQIKKMLKTIRVGENIGYNYNTPQSVLQAWLAKPDTKKNIEGDYRYFGLSMTIDASTGRKFFTIIVTK